MKILLEQLGISICGLVTTLFVVIVCVMIKKSTGIDLTGFSINLIPVSAIIAGLLAASGYYFGALYTQNRANLSILFFMAINAGIAQILIYWFNYTLIEVDGLYARDIIPFGEYLRYIFENTSLTSFGRRTGYHKFEDVGWFGYVLAATDFVGFMIGGFIAYRALRSETICPSCNLYLRTLQTVRHKFIDAESAETYVTAWDKEPLTNERISSLFIRNTIDGMSDAKTVQVTSTLKGCPICNYRELDHDVAVLSNKKFKSIANLSNAFLLTVSDDSKSFAISTDDQISQAEKIEL